MKKEVTVGQVMGFFCTLLVAVVTAWVTINNKVSVHDTEIKNLKEKQVKLELMLDRIENKIDVMNGKQTDILIKLESKQNR